MTQNDILKMFDVLEKLLLEGNVIYFNGTEIMCNKINLNLNKYASDLDLTK